MVEMATVVPTSTKRKGFDDNYDDICEMSLSQPATKIRRLDTEFPINVELQQVGYIHDDELPKVEIINAGLVRNEPFLPPTVNDERALVLYKPVYPSLRINTELMTSIKNLSSWSAKGDIAKELFNENGDQSSSINYLAVVPWVPSQAPSVSPGFEASTSRTQPPVEPMDEEQTEVASMEIEDECFHQSKQYCMIPELPQTSGSTPITWW